jgi:hypothetical protein
MPDAWKTPFLVLLVLSAVGAVVHNVVPVGPAVAGILAYPFGYYDMEADKIMREAGYQLTVTIDERINRLRAGDEECLRMLGRFNVTDHISGEALVDRLDHYFPDLSESKK